MFHQTLENMGKLKEINEYVRLTLASYQQFVQISIEQKTIGGKNGTFGNL